MFESFGDFMQSQTFIWVVLIAVFGIIEAFTLGLTTIWFAGGALVTSLISLVTDNFMVQVLVFLLVSLASVFFVRPLAKTKFNNKLIMTNVDALVGSIGRAKSVITKDEAGTVRADNKDWTAVLADGSESVAAGEDVKVIEIRGVKLVVKKA
ncbi:MAG: NfeD family protein [Anaerovoracaceae bacterium]